jgi:hypothetical protein
LVVVRAGDASLHPRWLDGVAPTFDLAVCYYGDDPKAFSDCALRYAVKGGKWDGLHAFFAANPGVFEKYDWIWLPDDDIATTTACINRLFDIAEKYALDVAQPSLTWDSYYAHFVTLQNPRFELRWTNYVEVMVPLLRTDLVRRIFPAFAGRRFGAGLDYLWSRWMIEPRYRTAVIDSVAVRHTRPVGKGNLSGSANGAQKAELKALLKAYGIQRPKDVVYAGRDTAGRPMERSFRLWLTLYMGWMPLSWNAYGTPHFPLKTGSLPRRVTKMVLLPFDLAPLPILPTEKASPVFRG